METRFNPTTILTIQPEIFAPFSRVKPAKHLIEKTANCIPGLVSVLDFKEKKPMYINQYGCNFFKRSKASLVAMGKKYQNNFFSTEEEELVNPKLEKLLISGSKQNSISFFQRIRPTTAAAYCWFFTTAQHYPSYPCKGIAFLHISLPIDNCSTMGKKLGQLAEENLFIDKNYKYYKLLTCREKEVLQFISEGKCSRKIAELLFISIHTVNNHRKNIIQKIGKKKLPTFIKLFPSFE